MKKFILSLVFLTSILHAQQIDIQKLKGMSPRAVGPAGMSGRITAIDVVNEKPNI